MSTIFPMYAHSIEFAEGPQLIVGTNTGTSELALDAQLSYYISFQGDGLGVIDISSDDALVQPLNLAVRLDANGGDIDPGSFSLNFNFGRNSANLTGIGVVHIEDIGIDGVKSSAKSSNVVLGNINYQLSLSVGSFIKVNVLPGTTDVFVLSTEVGNCIVSLAD